MLAVALTAALLGPGCQKDFKWNEPLAVTQNGLNLTSAAGSTRVTVYSTGRWKAEMAEGAWGEVSEVSGNGIGDFLFTYEANNGVSRRARILVSGEGEEQEIVLTQAGRGHRTDAGARRNRIRVRASAARTRPDRRYDQHDAGARMHPHHGNRRHRRGESRRSRLAEGDPARKRRRGEHRAGLRNRPQRRQQRPQGGDPARNPRCRRQDPRPSRSLRRPDHRQCDGRFQGRRDDRIRSGRPAQPQRTADGQLRRRSGALLLRHRIRPRRHAVDHGRDLQRIGRIVRRCREHGRPAVRPV